MGGGLGKTTGEFSAILNSGSSIWSVCHAIKAQIIKQIKIKDTGGSKKKLFGK